MLLRYIIYHGTYEKIWAKKLPGWHDPSKKYFRNNSEADYNQKPGLELFCTKEYRDSYKERWFLENPEYPKDCWEWVYELIDEVNGV